MKIRYTGSQPALGPTAPSVEQGIIWYALFAAALWIVAVIVVLQNKQMFMKKPATEGIAGWNEKALLP